jgi:hypothetical protein
VETRGTSHRSGVPDGVIYPTELIFHLLFRFIDPPIRSLASVRLKQARRAAPAAALLRRWLFNSTNRPLPSINAHAA